jgi:small-conductance mechanosensitive channel
MCFDSESSMLAWTLSYTIAWYLFNRNRGPDRWNAGFIIIFSCIQLLESWLWSLQNRKDDASEDLNDLLTRLVLVILILQPFFQSYLGYKYTQKTILGYMSILYAIVILWIFYRIWMSKKGQFSSYKGEKGHLVWSDSKNPNSFLGGVGIIYLIGIALPLIFMHGEGHLSKMFSSYSGVPLITIGIITALYSYIKTRNQEFGSFWCFTAVAYSLASIFI